jgi:hypothetical protein
VDALERVMRIRRGTASDPWPRERFRQATLEGRRRWKEAEELFGVQYSMLRQDAVAVIAPAFQLPASVESAARATDLPPGIGRPMTIWFVKWDQCPETAALPNPYEPWIEIWEHGGAINIEHGEFVEIYDSKGEKLGTFTVRRA